MSQDNRNADKPSQAGAAVYFSNPLMSDIESDWSPLHNTAFNGNLLSLRKLIDQGACVNTVTLDRVSALHGACAQGHTACAQLLIHHGANVNLATLDGSTPLSEACAGGHLASVGLLLQQGASVLGGDAHTHSPIQRAAAKGHTACVETLVKHGVDVNQHTEQLGSALYTACTNKHLSTAKRLLELGASANFMVGGDSPLHAAVRLCNTELVSTLLDHGADPSLRNQAGQRAQDLAPPDSPVQKGFLGYVGGTPGGTAE